MPPQLLGSWGASHAYFLHICPPPSLPPNSRHSGLSYVTTFLRAGCNSLFTSLPTLSLQTGDAQPCCLSSGTVSYQICFLMPDTQFSRWINPSAAWMSLIINHHIINILKPEHKGICCRNQSYHIMLPPDWLLSLDATTEVPLWQSIYLCCSQRF